MPVVTKIYVEPSGAEGAHIYSNAPGNMTNMSAMPVDGKKLEKSYSLEPSD